MLVGMNVGFAVRRTRSPKTDESGSPACATVGRAGLIQRTEERGAAGTDPKRLAASNLFAINLQQAAAAKAATDGPRS